MPAVRKVIYSDFMGGLNNRQEAHLIAPNEAQTAQNCDLQSGVLKPIKDVSSAITQTGGGSTPNASANFLAYAAGTFFISSTDYGGIASETRFALSDGNKTYITRAGRAPLCISPAGAQVLGIPAPSIISITIGGTGTGINYGSYKYRLTHETVDGMESNPSEEVSVINSTDTTGGFQIVVSAPAGNLDSRIAHTNVYRTKGSGGAFYRVGKILPSTTSHDDGVSDESVDVFHQLSVFPYGTGEFTDHAPAPPLTCIAQSLHSRNSSGVAGGGIVFGAVGATAYWSKLGYPHYWPLVNSFPFPETVESIISWQGVTFYMTANAIFQVDGNTDVPTDLTIQKTKATFGVVPGLGRLTKLTPYGVVFLCREGLGLFDGSDVRIISAKKLSRSFLQGLSFSTGAAEYFDGKYYLFHSTGTLRFDLRDGPDNIVVTTTTHLVRAACVGLFRDPVIADSNLGRVTGYVSAVSVSDSGKYLYGDTPTITFSGGGGTAAAATATVSVHSVYIESQTGGLTSVPTVSFGASPLEGGTAQAYAIVSGGNVTEIVVTNPGFGYGFGGAAMPSCTVSLGSVVARTNIRVTGAVVTTLGSGYTSAPTVAFSAPSAGGLRAVGAATVTPFATTLGGMVSDGTRYIYKMGGLARDNINGDIEATTRVERFDTQNNLWAAMAVIPAARCDATPVLRGDYIYLLGGTTGPFANATDGIMRRYRITTDVWDTVTALTALGVGPGLCAYAAATDGTDIFYYGGRDTTGAASNGFYRYNVTADTWTALATGADARHGCAMAYRSSNFTFYIFGGGSVSEYGGGASSTVITATNTGTMGTDTTGGANGYIGKYWPAVVQYNSQLWVLGGYDGYAGSGSFPGAQGTTTTSFTSMLSGFGSDLWQYDPAVSPTWGSSVGEVVGIGSRAAAGFAVIGSEMYVFGGSTKDDGITSGFYKVDLDSLHDNSRTAGVYVIQQSDSGGIKRFEGGADDMAMTWVGREETGEHPGPMLTLMRARVDHTGSSIAVSTLSNGATAVSQKSLSVGSTRTSSRFWFTPGTNKPRGQRVAVQIVSSGTSAAVYRIELDVKEDTPSGQ